MSVISNMYRGKTDINFPKLFRPMVVVSLILVAVSITSFFVRELNLSIDFEGGAVWEVQSATLTVADASAVLAEVGLEQGAKVQEAKDASGNRLLRVQADTKDVNVSRDVAQRFADREGISVDLVATNTVGPSWGSEITRQAGFSLLVFLVVIALYISWQLEWRMAASALAAVVHDIIITVGVYSIFSFEVTPATVISFLTILGYSLYDTIVVYDRVQENTARLDRSEKYTYSAIMRRSLNQVLMRSTNTTLIAILPVVSLLVIGAVLFGQATIRDFALALLIGLISGAYSSIFIAAPFVVWLKEKEPRYTRIRKKATDRGELAKADWIPMTEAIAAPAKVAAAAASTGSMPDATALKAAQYSRAHPPRPRKQGKTR